MLNAHGILRIPIGQGVFRQLPAGKAGNLFPAMGTETRETNRWIRSHILGHTSSVSNLAVQLVLVNAI